MCFARPKSGIFHSQRVKLASWLYSNFVTATKLNYRNILRDEFDQWAKHTYSRLSWLICILQIHVCTYFNAEMYWSRLWRYATLLHLATSANVSFSCPVLSKDARFYNLLAWQCCRITQALAEEVTSVEAGSCPLHHNFYTVSRDTAAVQSV